MVMPQKKQEDFEKFITTFSEVYEMLNYQQARELLAFGEGILMAHILNNANNDEAKENKCF